jgi:hypothetical protein
VSVSPGTGTEFEGAVADVSELNCAAEEDRWVVGGKVTNPTDTAADYRIYVSFLDGTGGTRGLLEVDSTDVAPGATAQWQGEMLLAETELTCVLRVERTPTG